MNFLPNIIRFLSITTQCIQKFHIDHKIFVESFLLWDNTKYDWSVDTLTAHFEQDLMIPFEQVNDFWRICSKKSR